MKANKTIIIYLIALVMMLVTVSIFVCQDVIMTENDETMTDDHYENYILSYDETRANQESVSPLEYYGYKFLSEHEKSENLLRAYNRVFNGVQNCDSDILLYDELYPLTYDDMQLVCYCFLMDYPQIFWLPNEYFLTMMGDLVYSIKYEYLFSADQLPEAKAQFDEAVSAILENVAELSDAEKEKYIHDLLAQQLTYSLSDGMIAHTSYGALVNNRAVCEGQAKIFQHLMREAGIPCMIVFGYASGGEHAWNIVKINDDYYNVDITWDNSYTQSSDNNISYKYYNLTNEQISKTHSFLQSAYPYPLCDSEWVMGD